MKRNIKLNNNKNEKTMSPSPVPKIHPRPPINQNENICINRNTRRIIV